MKRNLKGSKGERFMMYPRFMQMIFDEQYPTLKRGVITRDLKLLNESTFPLILQNRGGKYQFQGLHKLREFFQFAKIEDIDVAEVAEITNAVVGEEHDVQVVGSKSSDEDVYVVHPPEYEDAMTGNEPDLDFDFEMETIQVEGNPPPASSFTDQEPPLDTAADLVPRKKRRRDLRPGIVVSEPETEIISVTLMPTITVEPTEPVPLFKESTAGSSSHTEDVDYDYFLVGKTGTRADKGKNVLPDDEPIDVVNLHSRVFEIGTRFFISHFVDSRAEDRQ
ncbi:hypothetical protein R6Q57_009063 [Mikania cordata]